MKQILLLFTLLFFMGCEEKTTESYKPTAKKSNERVYIVGVHPYLNTKKMYDAYKPIFDYIESNIANTKFMIETSEDYATYEKKLYAQRFDFSLPNPYQTINSFKYNYYVIARMTPDEVFRGVIITRKDSHIQTPADLKGKIISFPAPTALAATMMPLHYLHHNGLNVNEDITKKFVGSQYSSIINVYAKDSMAGATWPPPWETWKKENPKMATELEVKWETKHLINNGFVAHNRVDTDLVKKVRTLLSELNKNDVGKKLLLNAGFEGFVVSENSDFVAVEKFLKIYDEEIGLPK
jgi:phosphonate transport system substrate-binding protein